MDEIRKWLAAKVGPLGYAITRAPVWVVILLTALLGLSAGLYYIWWNFDELSKKPGVPGIIGAYQGLKQGRIHSKEFLVAVAKFDNDDTGQFQRLVMDKVGHQVSNVTSYPSPIPAKSEALREQEESRHEFARSILKANGAEIMLWGSEIGRDHWRLYFTASASLPNTLVKESYEIRAFELPAEFLDDLKAAIVVLVALKSADLSDYGTNLKEIQSFIGKVEKLVENFREQPYARAALEFALANAFFVLGMENGENSFIEKAIVHYDETISEWSNIDFPVGLGAVYHNLGVSLLTLAERTENLEYLTRAHAALSKATAKRALDPTTQNLAETQNALALVIFREAERSGDITSLLEAEKLLKSAIKGLRQEDVRRQWADAQNNLGLVLWRLGEAERSRARLLDAQNALSSALPVRARDKSPLQWVKTQNNLGLVLWRIGESTEDKTYLLKGQKSFEQALKKCERNKTPLLWADIQNNLGLVLWRLGEREKNNNSLEAAVAAFGKALEERKYERVQKAWAQTQSNLGVTLWRLGEREHSVDRLIEAEKAILNALNTTTKQESLLGWASLHNRLGLARSRIGEYTHNPGQVRKALDSFREALSAYSEAKDALYTAMTQCNVSLAQRTLARIEGNKDNFQFALTSADLCLDGLPPDRTPFQLALAHFAKGEALLGLADHTRDRDLIKQSLSEFEAAIEGFQKWGASFNESEAQQQLENARQLLILENPRTS